MSEKIEKALKERKLISYDEIFESFSKEKQERIKAGARYIMARIELIKLRKKLKLSQGALAKKMKVKREFIARLESGKQNVTLDTLYKVAEATNKKFQFSFT